METNTWDVLDSIPYHKLYNCCGASPLLQAECDRPDYWKHRLALDFDYVEPVEDPQETYVGLISEEICTYGSERYRGIESCLQDALSKQDDDLVSYYVKTSIGRGDETELERVLYLLSFADRGDLAEALLDQLKFLPTYPAIRGAAEGGHDDLVLALMRTLNLEPRKAIAPIAEAGRWNLLKTVVDDMQLRGELTFDDLELALQHSAIGGHIEPTLGLSRVLRRQGQIPNIDRALVLAAIGGHRDLAIQLIANGADAIQSAATEAARHGHRALAQELIKFA